MCQLARKVDGPQSAFGRAEEETRACSAGSRLSAVQSVISPLLRLNCYIYHVRFLIYRDLYKNFFVSL
jgi:hypothetical protein